MEILIVVSFILMICNLRVKKVYEKNKALGNTNIKRKAIGTFLLTLALILIQCLIKNIDCFLKNKAIPKGIPVIQ